MKIFVDRKVWENQRQQAEQREQAATSSSTHSHPHVHAPPLLHPFLLSLSLSLLLFYNTALVQRFLQQHSKVSQMLKIKTKEL